MPITMSNATVETSERDNLLTSTVDTSVVSGGATANTQTTGALWWSSTEATGAALAGVTAEFANHVSTAIDTYIDGVKEALGKLQNVESNAAFKGEAISAALSKFVESVKEVGTSYIDRLSAAEKQIINSVQAAYATQDTDLSGNINADAGSLQN